MKTRGAPGLCGQLATMMTVMMMMMMISSARELPDSVGRLLRESRALDSCDQSSNQWRQWGPRDCRSRAGDLSTCHESKRGPQAAHVPRRSIMALTSSLRTQANCGTMKSCVKTRRPRIIFFFFLSFCSDAVATDTRHALLVQVEA